MSRFEYHEGVPVMGEKNIQRLFDFCEPKDLQFPNVVSAPHAACAIGRAFKVALPVVPALENTADASNAEPPELRCTGKRRLGYSVQQKYLI